MVSWLVYPDLVSMMDVMGYTNMTYVDLSVFCFHAATAHFVSMQLLLNITHITSLT